MADLSKIIMIILGDAQNRVRKYSIISLIYGILKIMGVVQKIMHYKCTAILTQNHVANPNGPLRSAIQSQSNLASGERVNETQFRRSLLMNNDAAEKVASILSSYTSIDPDGIAQALRTYWLEFEPNQGVELIKADVRANYEAVGIPIPVLQVIGKEIAKAARRDLQGYLPLAQKLWDSYGREGRVVALIIFGAMVPVEPERLVPLLKELCKGCLSWEDADRLAMDAVEPIVRKYPDLWLGEIATWLTDENKWVRRASITIIGRLPMKHPAHVQQCLAYAEQLLLDTELDVKRAVSFAIRMCAKVNSRLAYDFLEKQLEAPNAAAVWVLCDVIKSMDRKITSTFSPLLPGYERWSASSEISAKDRRSLESAIKVLQNQ